jgi:hypothetical protein
LKLEEKKRAVELREQGLSYNEIAKIVPVSKGTISIWLRDHHLTDDQTFRLAYKGGLASIDGGRRMADKWKQKRKDLLKDYAPATSNPLFMLGLGLYWGEGSKYTSNSVAMTNADLNVHKVFIAWIHRFFVPEPRFTVSVQHYYPDRDTEIKEYWSKSLGVPIEDFIKSQFKASKISLKKRNTLPYGTINLRLKGCSVWEVRAKIGKALEEVGYVQPIIRL